MFFLHIGMKTGHYAVSVIDGTQSGRKQLQKDKRDFEYQKSWLEDERRKLQEENEKIMKAWEDLIKEREEFEKQRDKGSYEKKDYSDNKSYKERKEKYEEKSNTGRYFKEFEKYDLNDFTKNNAKEVLGVNDGDTKAIIKKKYYKLAMKFHPDKHHDESSDKMKEATQILQLLNDCYEMVG